MTNVQKCFPEWGQGNSADLVNLEMSGAYTTQKQKKLHEHCHLADRIVSHG